MKLNTDPRVRATRLVDGRELHLQRVHSAHRVDRRDGQHDHHGHLDDELQQVRHQHAPQSRERRNERRDRDQPQHNAERLQRASRPSASIRIFTIARFTQPSTMQLTGTPRYSARNPRKKAAGRPE